MLVSSSNKPSKLRTRNSVEINNDIRGAYSPNKQIRFKTAMPRSSLCDCSDAYILVKGNIYVNNSAAECAAANNAAKKVITRIRIVSKTRIISTKSKFKSINWAKLLRGK